MKTQTEAILTNLGEVIAELKAMLNPEMRDRGFRLEKMRERLVRKELVDLIRKMINGHITLHMSPIDAATMADEIIFHKYGVEFELEDVIDIWMTEDARMRRTLNH